ncbi:MAG: SagB/ThcOx family dehydrogenase [Lentisphaerae bacterium]|nr:SagB/ThcOx family dehydrogenase [Lentisphaerota bacterium]
MATVSCDRVPRAGGTDAPDDPDPCAIAAGRAFLKGYAGDWRQDTDQKRGQPPPPVQKPYPPDAAIIELAHPDALNLGRLPLADAINRRRSRREYTAEPLTRGELSFLLWCTQGVERTVKNARGRAIQTYRTVPSGGARHPFETYLLVHRVAGLEPGIYRYLALEHALLSVGTVPDLPEAATRACYGQAFVGEAAVVFVWAAVPYRTEWRYGCIAHRMIAMEAGHICQNLYLAAEAIGAGACAVLGYDQRSLDGLLGLDGRNEFAVYLAPVGRVGERN